MRVQTGSAWHTRSSPLHMRCVLYLVLLLLVGAMTHTHAATQSYVLQRRIGTDADWQDIVSFTLTRKTPLSAPQLSSHPVPQPDLTREQKHTLTSANLLYYRATVKNKDGAASHSSSSSIRDSDRDAAVAAVITATPCTVIRGFTAVDKETVSLQERVGVVPGEGVSILGLQMHSETNFFHSKMTDGDACDRSVVDKLFPRVRMSAEVELLRPLEVTHPVRYEDLRFFGKNAAKEREKVQNQKKTVVTKVTNEQGEVVEEEKVVEEKSFLQKYGIYIVVFVVMSIMRNMRS